MAKASIEGWRVLLIDDDEDQLVLLESLLAKAGAKTALARNVKEAVGGFRALRPDVIVSDLDLGSADGRSLLQALQDVSAEPLHAVALSGTSEEIAGATSAAAGFSVYLTKPVTGAKLTAAIVRARNAS